jgi:hypothetical protein
MKQRLQRNCATASVFEVGVGAEKLAP